MPGGFSGSSAINGVVTTNDGRTIDGRILRQNFNVVDADMSATTYWTKFKTNWQPAHTIELRNQAYYYWAERNWQNAETYQFNPGTQLIDRDRFFVQHDQYIVGDRMEAQIKERLFEHGNRFVIGVEFSHLHLNRPSFFGGETASIRWRSRAGPSGRSPRLSSGRRLRLPRSSSKSNSTLRRRSS